MKPLALIDFLSSLQLFKELSQYHNIKIHLSNHQKCSLKSYAKLLEVYLDCFIALEYFLVLQYTLEDSNRNEDCKDALIVPHIRLRMNVQSLICFWKEILERRINGGKHLNSPVCPLHLNLNSFHSREHRNHYWKHVSLNWY